jgi:hypothetical protein
LTAQDVLSRLPQATSTATTTTAATSGTVNILSLDSHPDKPYCQVTATTVPTTATTTAAAGAGEPESAFHVFYKTFNNVKWKGCRLTVQKAQPHFLDRLRQEIHERDALRQPPPPPPQPPLQPPPPHDDSGVVTTTLPPPPPRRRLRIRKKFGEEAYHVDTKPWSVDNWTMFRMARDKLTKRVEKHQHDQRVRKSTTKRRGEDTTTTRPPPVPQLLYRAVHIRFDKKPTEDRHDDEGNDGDDAPPSLHDDPSSPGADTASDEETSSSSGGSEPSAGQRHANVVDTPLVPTEYTWSDEAEDNESDKEEEEEDQDGKNLLRPILPSEKRDDPGMDASRDKFINQIKPQQQQQKLSSTTKETEYHWSSDEESDDNDDDNNDDSDDEEEEQRERNRPLRQVSQSDEFAAGIGDDDFMEPDDNDDHDDDEMESTTNDDSCVVEESDLANDVLVNLGIFSSMFSQGAGDDTKPIVAKGTVQEDKGKMTTQQQQPRTGFGQSGMMLRYDPNDATMHQFEIQEEEPEQNSGNSRREDDAGEVPPDKESEAKSDSVPAQEDPGHLYEEKKLENVFREARDTWKGTMDDQETEVKNAGGAFSFGFDLEPVEKNATNLATQDSPPAWPSTERTSDRAHEPAEDAATTASEAQKTHMKPKVHERRIQGFCFPDDLLAKYQAAFFVADQRAGNESEDKEAWTKERLALTLDWKRKRKHAQTRIQKRMKLR